MTQRVAAGTLRTGNDPATGKPIKTLYTLEQHERLQTMKDDSYSLGVARAEFAGMLLCPNGDVIDDQEGMRAAAYERAKAATAEAQRLSMSPPPIGDPDAAAQHSLEVQQAWSDAGIATRRVQEVEDAIAAYRFLFVVDTDLMPLIYFQAATEHNTDIHHLRIPATTDTAPSASTPAAE